MAKKNISKENKALELILPDIMIYNKYILIKTCVPQL